MIGFFIKNYTPFQDKNYINHKSKKPNGSKSLVMPECGILSYLYNFFIKELNMFDRLLHSSAI